MTNSKNPFNKEETIQNWLNSDEQYHHSKQQSLFDFQQKHNLNNNFIQSIFMSLKEKYINFAHLISKNVIVATIIMLIALTTVGASATELLAPEEFKPSTQIKNLFAANQQKETNPYTALKPDENNDVVSMDKCNMSIKYPKKVDNLTTEYFISGDINEEKREDRPYFYDETYNGQNSLQTIAFMAYSTEPWEDNYHPLTILPYQPELSIKGYGYQSMFLSCFDNLKLGDVLQSDPYSKSISKEELRLLTGWFITEGELENIMVLDHSEDGRTYFSFSYENMVYGIYINNGEMLPISSSNQIQLQFNSLVKNEASVEILDKKPEVVQPQPEVKEEDTDTIEAPEVKEDIIEPLVADENHDVVVIDECDLAVRFAKNIIVDGENHTRKIGYSKERLFLTNLNKNVMDEPSGMDITCSNKKTGPPYSYAKLPHKTKQETCNILNLTEVSCNKIEIFEPWIMTREDYTPNRDILFKFKANNKEYRISLGYVNPEKQGLENIQIQFNSLAPSTPSIKLRDIQLTEDEINMNTSDRI